MKRITNTSERWLLYFSQRYPFNFSYYLKVRGKIEKEDLTIAVNKMRIKHSLAFTRMIDEEGGLKVMTTDGVKDPDIVELSSDTSDFTVLVKSIFMEPFINEEGPLFRVGFRNSDGVTDLIFIFQHAISDGLGAIDMIKDVMSALAGDYNWEGKNQILPTMSDVVKDSVKQDLENMKPAELDKRVKEAYSQNYPKNEKEIEFVRPDFSLTSIVLNKDELYKFKMYGKNNGLTIHSLLASIFLKASAELNGPDTGYTRELQCPVDMRKYMKQEVLGRLGLYNGLVFTNIECQVEKSYLEIGEEIQKSILEGQSNYKDLLGYYWSKEFTRIPYSENYMATVVEEPATIDFSLSNVGLVNWEESYGDYVIEEVFGPTITASNSEFVIGVNGSVGKLFITMIYDKKVYDNKKGEAFVKLANQRLKEFINEI